MINWADLEAAATGFSALFKDFYARITPQYSKIAMETISTGAKEKYNWLRTHPKMREWLGERILKMLAAEDYEIVNKTWEATIEVFRDEFEDDKLGLVTPRVQELALEGGRHMDELVFSLLENGFTGLCYDGQYFFDSDHVEGSSGVQTNTSALALSAANYGTLRANMQGIKDSEGKPMGIIPDTLVVPPALEVTARLILNADFVPNVAGTAAQTNIWKGSANLVISPYITTATKWFLLDVSRVIRPLIAQMRRLPDFSALTDPKGDFAFRFNKYLFGADYRGNAGYGLWQLAYGSTGV